MTALTFMLWLPLLSALILSTMRVPRYDLGEMVLELPLRVIEADGDHKERLPVRPELVVRDSCGARRWRPQE